MQPSPPPPPPEDPPPELSVAERPRPDEPAGRRKVHGHMLHATAISSVHAFLIACLRKLRKEAEARADAVAAAARPEAPLARVEAAAVPATGSLRGSSRGIPQAAESPVRSLVATIDSKVQAERHAMKSQLRRGLRRDKAAAAAAKEHAGRAEARCKVEAARMAAAEASALWAALSGQTDPLQTAQAAALRAAAVGLPPEQQVRPAQEFDLYSAV
jgi:hypothetical protein